MIVVLLLACGGSFCDENAAADGEAVLEIDGSPWRGPISWMLAGDSLQLNADAVDGQWVSIVAQQSTDGAVLSAAITAPPVEVDLAVGGWGVLYSDSDSDRSVLGSLTISDQDASGNLQGCISFTTEGGTLVEGSFSATP